MKQEKWTCHAYDDFVCGRDVQIANGYQILFIMPLDRFQRRFRLTCFDYIEARIRQLEVDLYFPLQVED